MSRRGSRRAGTALPGREKNYDLHELTSVEVVVIDPAAEKHPSPHLAAKSGALLGNILRFLGRRRLLGFLLGHRAIRILSRRLFLRLHSPVVLHLHILGFGDFPVASGQQKRRAQDCDAR